MQEPRNANEALPELSFLHSFASSDSSMDPQSYWNHMMNPSQTQPSDPVAPFSNGTSSYLNLPCQEGHSSSGWNFGESSSSGACDPTNRNNSKNDCSRPSLVLGERQYELLDNLSLNGFNGDPSRSLHMPSSSVPSNLITNLEAAGSNEDENSDDDCQVIECIPSGSRHLSSKRKMRETSFGQSSGSGSSNDFQNLGSSLWQGPAISHNAPGNNIGINMEGPRLGLSIGEPASEFPLSLGNAERSHRNLRLRINTSHQQEGPPVTFSSTQRSSLRLPPVSNSFDQGPSNVTEDGGLQRPMVSSLRRNAQSRGPRAGSSSSAFAFEEPYLRSFPGAISQHPMYLPATEIGSSSQNPDNRNLAAKNVGMFNVASSSHGGLIPPLVPHHHSPDPSRLPEYSRRSLITRPGIGTANQFASHNPIHSGPPEITFPSTSSNHGQHRFTARSAVLLQRHLGSTVGMPHPLRGLASSSEGGSRLVSEIRNVLDRMRRGEPLRVEDLMILDQSGFFGITDLHDRHRDMRLDVDNMSYEELLALEERIGDVCTGLSEETISSRLKQRKYFNINTHTQVEEEPCCICREEYNDGEGLGILECGHEFHSGCIKQWLMQKNLCPICKTTGLNN